MSSEIKRIHLPHNAWFSVNADQGFAEGTNMLIQNVGDHPVLVAESSTEPTPNTGYFIAGALGSNSAFARCIESPTGIWLRSSGNQTCTVMVQKL